MIEQPTENPRELSTSCLTCGMPALWHVTQASTISHEYDSEFTQNQSMDTEGWFPTSLPAQPQRTPTTSTPDVPSATPKKGSGKIVSEEVRSTSSTGAQKGVKPERFDLIPVPALKLLARLYGKGAEKYAEHNWRAGYDWSKSYAAAQRHMQLFWNGEDFDDEMELPHVTCAAFHMFALATFMAEHPEFDDRYKARQPPCTEEDRLQELRVKLFGVVEDLDPMLNPGEQLH